MINRILLDQLYVYKSTLENQIIRLDENKEGPFSNEYEARNHTILTEAKNQQLNMVLKILDLYLEPYK